jgi:hypothetical protein
VPDEGPSLVRKFAQDTINQSILICIKIIYMTITESYSVNKVIINIKSETLLTKFGLGNMYMTCFHIASDHGGIIETLDNTSMFRQ